LTIQSNGNVLGTSGVVSSSVIFNGSFGEYGVFNSGSGVNRQFLNETYNKLQSYDGTNVLQDSDIPFNTGVNKIAFSWGSNMRIIRNGGTSTSQIFDGDMNPGTNMEIGDLNASIPLYGNIKNLRIWNRSFSDDELVLITQ
jgi:hypothetical protein